MRSPVKAVSLEAIFHLKIRFIYATPTEKGQHVLSDTMRDVRHKGTHRSCVSVLRVTVSAANSRKGRKRLAVQAAEPAAM